MDAEVDCTNSNLTHYTGCTVLYAKCDLAFILSKSYPSVPQYRDSQRMQLVDGLVLMCSLKIQLNLLDQRQAVGTGDIQLLRFSDSILLKESVYAANSKMNENKLTLFPAFIDSSTCGIMMSASALDRRKSSSVSSRPREELCWVSYFTQS